MQVFRLMGMPDKIIAFDELPERLVKGFEQIKAEGFPKYWKKWMGEKEMVTKIPSELNPVTGERRTYEPFVEKDSYFYVVDWGIKPAIEKWKEIEGYVRNNVSSEFRLTDKLEDMAKPLAPDKISGITLEPDEVVIIPIPKELVGVSGQPLVEEITFKCPEKGCDAEYEGKYAKNALHLHTLKKHPAKEKVAA